MKMELDYKTITLQHIEDNKHLVFVCDGDKQKVKVESENL